MLAKVDINCAFRLLSVHPVDQHLLGMRWRGNVYVTQSDKKELIARKYMCSLNNMYLKFSIKYYNSVTFIKLSINFYISGKSFK